jgi:hypothetical protein
VLLVANLVKERSLFLLNFFKLVYVGGWFDMVNWKVFLSSFCTQTWNLMCWSQNSVFIQMEHLDWSADAMTYNFAHAKTDTVRAEAGYYRHIYANPNMPEISPELDRCFWKAFAAK